MLFLEEVMTSKPLLLWLRVSVPLFKNACIENLVPRVTAFGGEPSNGNYRSALGSQRVEPLTGCMFPEEEEEDRTLLHPVRMQQQGKPESASHPGPSQLFP